MPHPVIEREDYNLEFEGELQTYVFTDCRSLDLNGTRTYDVPFPQILEYFPISSLQLTQVITLYLAGITLPSTSFNSDNIQSLLEPRIVTIIKNEAAIDTLRAIKDHLISLGDSSSSGIFAQLHSLLNFCLTPELKTSDNIDYMPLELFGLLELTLADLTN